MGLMDRAKKLASKQNVDKAKGLVAKNADKISGAVDKATSSVDKRTGGKYRDKLDKLNDTVDRNLEKARDEGDGDGTAGDRAGGPS